MAYSLIIKSQSPAIAGFGIETDIILFFSLEDDNHCAVMV